MYNIGISVIYKGNCFVEDRCVFDPFNENNDVNHVTGKKGVRSHGWFTAMVLRIFNKCVTIKDSTNSVIYLNKNSLIKWLKVHEAENPNQDEIYAKRIANVCQKEAVIIIQTYIRTGSACRAYEISKEKECKKKTINITLTTKVCSQDGAEEFRGLIKRGAYRSRYELIHPKTEKVLGFITLGVYGDHIYIILMRNYSKDDGNPYKNVGASLHEFAIRKSFKKGFEGRIHLQTSWGSDMFHFKCGFRYLTSKELRFGDYARREIGEAVAAYLNKEDAEAKEKIENSSIYEDMVDSAKKELQREPQNLREIIEYGYYKDANVYLDRVIYHPEDERLSDYDRSLKKYDRGGIMILSDQARQQWKERLY